jgi:hypothetical protein
MVAIGRTEPVTSLVHVHESSRVESAVTVYGSSIPASSALHRAWRVPKQRVYRPKRRRLVKRQSNTSRTKVAELLS